MKILFVNTLDDPRDGAGAERTISVLTQTLKEAGHDVAIAATSDMPGLHRHDRDGIRIWRAGIQNLYWPRREDKVIWPLRRAWHWRDSYNPGMGTQFKEILRLEAPDVISAHNLPGWSVSILDAAQECGIPVVQVLHDYYYACANTKLYKASQDCERQCLSCGLLRRPHRNRSSTVKAVVGVSRYVLQRHQALGYFLNGPAPRVIHNVRARAMLNPAGVPRRHRQAGAPLVLGFIGTVDQHKGVELLLKTFGRLKAGAAELLIAGTGKADYVDGLKREFGGRGVEFLGHVPPREFFPRIDVTIVPSLWAENFPGVVLESFAFGVPVIGSRRGGIPEMIKPGRNGMLFEPTDPDALFDAINSWIERPELIMQFGQNALQDAEPFLDTEAWIGHYLHVYQEAAMARVH